MKYIKYIM